MALKPTLTLPDRDISKCMLWAYEAAITKRMLNSVSCFGAETNITLLAHSKMAECALARFLGLDPETAVHWGDYPDNGSDVLDCDVKHAVEGRKFLIWPVTKKHLYELKQFSRLVFVRGSMPTFEIVGWVSKDDFRAMRKTADDYHKLYPGTWYMEDSELNNFEYWREAAE